jgi:hypothetical protein
MADIDDMKKTNDLFRHKFKGLIEINEYGNGKIGVYNDATYVSWNYFQGIQRRLYGESIDSLLIFINTTLEDYFIFYNMILFFILLHSNNVKNTQQLTDISGGNPNIKIKTKTKIGNTMTLSTSDHDLLIANINVIITEEEIEYILFLQKENAEMMKKINSGLNILKSQYVNYLDKQTSIDSIINKIEELLSICS